MPQVLAKFDPNAIASSQFPTNFPNGVGTMVIWNESNQNLLLTWGAYQAYAPAWMATKHCVESGSAQISWTQHSTVATNSNPISQVVVETYNSQEPIPGVFPVHLPRVVNSGNPGAVIGSASNIVNDGNVVGTQVVEVTPTGAASSTVSLLNDGTFVINGDVAGVLTQLFKTVPNPSGANADVIIGSAAHHVKFPSFLEVDGQSVNIAGSQVGRVNGNVSGSCFFYMDMQGTLQRLSLVFSNYKNTVTDAAAVILPSPFTVGSQYLAGNVPNIEAHSGAGGALSANVSNGFGTFLTQSFMQAFTWGEVPASFDRLILKASFGLFNGIVTFTGV